MSDDKNIPDRRSWIERMEDSVGRHTDPIERLAQYFIPFRNNFKVTYLEDYGSLHFAPPTEWREQHPFIPKGILHCEGGGRPFSKAVEDGSALIYWLSPKAMMGNVPEAHAREVLWKRAEAMCTALKGKLDIEPLEYSLYFPRGNLREAIAGEPYDACAALIIATDPKNAAVLKDKGVKLIASAQLSHDVVQESTEETPAAQHTTGMESLRMLTQAPVRRSEATLQELGFHLQGKPLLIERSKKGEFFMPMLDTGKNTKDARPTGPELGLPEGTEHVLAIPIDEHYLINPPRETGILSKKKPKPLTPEAETQNNQRLTQLIHELSDAYHCKFTGTYLHHMEADIPSMLVLAAKVEFPEEEFFPDEVLTDIGHRVRNYHINAHDQENDWRRYCDDRNTEHRPPSR